LLKKQASSNLVSLNLQVAVWFPTGATIF